MQFKAFKFNLNENGGELEVEEQYKIYQKVKV